MSPVCQIGENVTALASAGETTYAGASSGALWVSRDRGATWRRSRLATGSPIEAIFAVPGQPGQALAVLTDPGGEGGHPRVLRTVDGGFNWEDLSGDLPSGSVWGVTADPGGTAIYVATDRGVFLSVAGPGSARLGDHWIPMSENLPAVPVRDVKLNETGYQIYIAVAGYGVYAAPAPHRFLNVEVANAADFSQRPAAPGSLLTVLGGRLIRAQAGLVQAPILHASDTQSELQIPFELSGPSPLLSLELSQGRLTLNIPLREASPAIFVDREGSAMLMDGDSGVLLDALTPGSLGVAGADSRDRPWQGPPSLADRRRRSAPGAAARHRAGASLPERDAAGGHARHPRARVHRLVPRRDSPAFGGRYRVRRALHRGRRPGEQSGPNSPCALRVQLCV